MENTTPATTPAEPASAAEPAVDPIHPVLRRIADDARISKDQAEEVAEVLAAQAEHVDVLFERLGPFTDLEVGDEFDDCEDADDRFKGVADALSVVSKAAELAEEMRMAIEQFTESVERFTEARETWAEADREDRQDARDALVGAASDVIDADDALRHAGVDPDREY